MDTTFLIMFWIAHQFVPVDVPAWEMNMNQKVTSQVTRVADGFQMPDPKGADKGAEKILVHGAKVEMQTRKSPKKEYRTRLPADLSKLYPHLKKAGPDAFLKMACSKDNPTSCLVSLNASPKHIVITMKNRSGKTQSISFKPK